LDKVLRLSLRQIQGFISLSVKSKASEDLALALIIRMAHHADGKKFKEFMQALDKE